MNTKDINEIISTISTNNEVIYENDNFCFVNLDYLTTREYQSQGVDELLYILGQRRGKVFVFLCRDGVNCNFTGLSNVIAELVSNLDLTAKDCYISSYENLNIPNTTFVEFDVIQMWCSQIYQDIKSLPLSSYNCNKKFAALFGRHTLYRLKFFKYLFENYSNDSLLSYNSRFGNWNERFLETFFKDDKIWFDENCPKLLDFKTSRGWVPFQESLQLIGTHYQSYFIEIVCETDPHSTRFFTEKTLKNFYLGKPFLLFAGYQSLMHLQQKGFKTFNLVIDESYDQIKCPYSRYRAILDEIDRLASLSYDELNCLSQQLQLIFEHNRQKFLEISLTS